MQARLAALEAENKALRDRFAEADTERNAAQAALKAAFARVAELEAEAKQARDDEVWAEDNGVVIDAEPVEKGWCAMLVREDGPLIEVPSAKGPTIHAALRALRAKVEGGAR
jgi:hypothetical protein